RERADPVALAGFLRGDVVGETEVRAAGPLLELLPQPAQHYRAPLAGVDLDVVADRIRREKSQDGARPHQSFGHDPFQERLRVREEFACRVADDRVLEDRGVIALQLPRLEERRPVDVRYQLVQGVVVEYGDPGAA